MGSGLHMDPLPPTLVGGLFATLLVGLVLRQLRQPHVIAWLVGGVLPGPHGLAVLDDEALVSRPGGFGVVLLVFVGMEVSLERLAEVCKLALRGTLPQVLLGLGAAALLAQVGESRSMLAAVGLQAGLVSDCAHQCSLALIAVTLVLSPAWIALVERLVGGLPASPVDSPAARAAPTP